MGSIPLPALSIRPPTPAPDPIEQYGKIMQLRQMAQQQQDAPYQSQILQQHAQQGQIDLQNAQQAQKDQQATTQALQSWDGKSYDALAQSAAKNGASANAVMGITAAGLKHQEELQTILKTQGEIGATALANRSKQNDMVAGEIGSIEALPDAQLAQGLLQRSQEMAESGELDPQHAQQAQQLAQSGDPKAIRNGLAIFKKGFQSDSAQIEDALKQAQAQKALRGPSMQSVNLVGPGGKPVKANYHPTDGTYTDANGNPIQNPVPWEKPAIINNGASPGSAVDDAAHAIYEGKAPPVLTEYSYRDRTNIVSGLRKLDANYNLAQAEQDWKATQKYLATLNGAQQTRLRQAISFTNDTLPQIQDAYNAWKATGLPNGFKIYNRAALDAAANLPGAAGSKAANLKALIGDFTSELGTVYKGGNSSTDESLKLAATNLSGDWNDQTFNDAMGRIGRSLRIRQNSMNLGATGISGDSPYHVPGANQPSQAQPNSNDPLGIR